jgi:hypothetical protein
MRTAAGRGRWSLRFGRVHADGDLAPANHWGIYLDMLPLGAGLTVSGHPSAVAGDT